MNGYFRSAFSLSSFTLIKRLFISSSFFAIRVVSSSYLRLLIFLLGFLIPACDWFSLEFHIMYSAYNLKKQGDNIQLCHTPFLVLNLSIVPCVILTCFLTHIQVSQETSQVVWYSYLFKNFPYFTVIHTVKGFNIVS